MSTYQIAKRGITDLHRLALRGSGEGPRAQEIRDGLEKPFLLMTIAQLASLTRFGDRLDRRRGHRSQA